MAASVLGIDFGTSNTSAAWVDDKGLVRLMPVKDGVTSLPSVVWFDQKGNALVGEAARERALTDPDGTILGWKRFLGRRFLSDFVQRNRDRVPYRLCAGPDGLCAVAVHDKVRTLEEVTFQVIKRVLELSEPAAGHPFEQCILTVPAHAGFRQRRAVRSAAEMAGLDVLSVMNEPTAAAFSVLLLHDHEGAFLVFDLGGGTLDVTLLSMWQGLVQVIALDGDMFLGGHDFDHRLVDALLERYLDDKGVDLRGDPVVLQRIAFAAEHAKIALSTEEQARVTVRAVATKQRSDALGFIDLDYGIKRALLEQVTATLVEKAAGIARGVLDKSRGVKVDGVVFVGGMTRMPLLRRRVLDTVGLPAMTSIDPDTAVAIGAAEAARGKNIVMDVVPMSIGMMLPGGVSQEIVAPSSVVPCGRKVPLARPASGMLVLAFYEAVSSIATERDMLGTAKVDPAWLAMHPGQLFLEVKLDRDLELTVAIKAADGTVLPLPIVLAR